MEDPVIEAAAAVQQAVSDAVAAVGAGWLAVALVGLLGVIGMIGLSRLFRRRRQQSSAAMGRLNRQARVKSFDSPGRRLRL
jgi:hypothetical protein